MWLGYCVTRAVIGRLRIIMCPDWLRIATCLADNGLDVMLYIYVAFIYLLKHTSYTDQVCCT